MSLSAAPNHRCGNFLEATILAADKCTIENLPCISDVMASLQILSELGASIRMISKSTYEIDTTHLNCTEVSNELSCRTVPVIIFWARCWAALVPVRLPCPVAAIWDRARLTST